MSIKKEKVKMSVIVVAIVAVTMIFPSAISLAKMQFTSTNNAASLKNPEGNQVYGFGIRKASASDAEILDDDILNEDEIMSDESLILASNSNASKDFSISGSTLTGYNGQDSLVIIPDGVTTIADEAFIGNDTIEELYLPDSVETVGVQAFAEMSTLRIIHFGDVFEADYVDIFLDSPNIEEYVVVHPSSGFYSEDGILYVNSDGLLAGYYPESKTGDNYIIPAGVDLLFLNGNSYLSSLHISESVSRIDFKTMGTNHATKHMQLVHITVEEGSDYYYVSDKGVLTEKQNDAIVFDPASSKTSQEQ